MKRILSLFVILAMMLSSIVVFAAETTAPVFADVDANSTTGKAVYKLVNAGILNGYTDGTFRPNNPITRAELCKIVNLVFNYTEADKENFTDVGTNDWFYSYVAIAKKAGYITGHGDGTFKGNDYLTREQACAIITRVTKLFDLPMTETITDTVSDWAVPYVNKVVANRLMALEAGGKFRATENITRGELTAVMAVFVDVEEKPSGNTEMFTVSFNTNGGSSIDAVKVEAGKTVAKPTSPTKKGHTFNGWYTDSALTKTYDFTSPVTADITLYSKWSMASGGGGGGSSSSSTPSKPEIDEEKQEEAVASLKSMLSVLNKTRFNPETGETEVIGYVKQAINSVIADAGSGKAIYKNNYISNEYSDLIDKALATYLDMDEKSQGDFESKLVELKKDNYKEVNELSKLLFNKSIDEIEDMVADKTTEEE